MADSAQSDTQDSAAAKRPREQDPAFTWKHILPIILSLVALTVSVRQSFIANEAATITAYDRGVNPVLELDKAYLANNELRPYFYENKHLDSGDPSRTRVLALAEMTLDVFENVMVQLTEHPGRFPARQTDGDVAWITDAFKSSEVLRDYIDQHQTWYGKTIKDLRARVKP